MYPSLKDSQPHQFPQPRRYLTYLPSTEIRNILVRSNSEAPVIDFPKKVLENPMNISAT